MTLFKLHREMNIYMIMYNAKTKRRTNIYKIRQTRSLTCRTFRQSSFLCFQFFLSLVFKSTPFRLQMIGKKCLYKRWNKKEFRPRRQGRERPAQRWAQTCRRFSQVG